MYVRLQSNSRHGYAVQKEITMCGPQMDPSEAEEESGSSPSGLIDSKGRFSKRPIEERLAIRAIAIEVYAAMIGGLWADPDAADTSYDVLTQKAIEAATKLQLAMEDEGL